MSIQTFVIQNGSHARVLFCGQKESFDVERSISISFCDHTLQINQKPLVSPKHINNVLCKIADHIKKHSRRGEKIPFLL